MTSATTPDTKPPRARRWLWIALVASLAVNLAVLGALAGAGLSWRYGAATFGPAGGPNLIGFAQQLPPERRAEVRRVAQASRSAIMPLRREARLARRDAARLMLAEPFDKAAFRAAQVRVIEAELRIRQATVDVLADVAATLTPTERREFLSWRSIRSRESDVAPQTGDDPSPVKSAP